MHRIQKVLLSTCCFVATLTAPSAYAQSSPPGGTVLPTDIVPLPGLQEGPRFGDNFKLKVLQSLPSKFYMSSIFETSLRDETNVYQYPMRRNLLSKFAAEPDLTSSQQATNSQVANLASKNDAVFRLLPNITAGWAFTPKTRAYANYFLIRDQLFHQVSLNTTIQSVGGGVLHDIPLGKKANLQLNAQFRELFQNKQVPVFDYLPTATLSYALTSKSILFVSTLLQLRGRHFAEAPTREIDPFYELGWTHQRGYWTFSATGTYLQNFRQLFDSQALIPISNYAFVTDFEVARSLVKRIPGLQSFVRAETIWNLHSKETVGLSGVDFRIFGGIRFGIAKPALTDAMQKIHNQLDEHEAVPPPPRPTALNPSNSPSVMNVTTPPSANALSEITMNEQAPPVVGIGFSGGSPAAQPKPLTAF